MSQFPAFALHVPITLNLQATSRLSPDLCWHHKHLYQLAKYDQFVLFCVCFFIRVLLTYRYFYYLSQLTSEQFRNQLVATEDVFNHFRSTGLHVALQMHVSGTPVAHESVVPAHQQVSYQYAESSLTGHFLHSHPEDEENVGQSEMPSPSHQSQQTKTGVIISLHCGSLNALIRVGMMCMKIPPLPRPRRRIVGSRLGESPRQFMLSCVSGFQLRKSVIDYVTISLWEGLAEGPSRGIEICISGIQLQLNCQEEDPNLLLEQLQPVVDVATRNQTLVSKYFLQSNQNIWSISDTNIAVQFIKIYTVGNELWQHVRQQKTNSAKLREEILKVCRCLILM
jgi:hypothetical protein